MFRFGERSDRSRGQLIARASDGMLRAARNLTLATLIEAVRAQKKQAELDLVNKALLQPHWRSIDEFAR